MFGQPSWRIATRDVEAWLTRTGGHLAPVRFRLPGRTVTPYQLAPWCSERVDRALPPILRVLRGDFFCLPFGANAKPHQGEHHPLHGETANANWQCLRLERGNDGVTLHCRLQSHARRGSILKTINLKTGQTALYCQHVISGMSGAMPVGHHATLRFPSASDGGGIVSVSRFVLGQTFPGAVESPENRGYSTLAHGAEFDSLKSVPLLSGQRTDLTRYPARRGFEDIALVAADPSLPFAWTAVVFPKQRYVWFALRDPRVLRSTMFWFSNGGRHYPPWNSRHVDVLGLEDLTSNFYLGLADSVRPNALSRRGIPTSVRFLADRPLVVNYIMAVADLPVGFDEVADIRAVADGRVTLVARNGKRASARVDARFLDAPAGAQEAGAR
jgi:hypothetical protein